LSAVNFDLSEKDHSPRFRVFGVFTQPGSISGYYRIAALMTGLPPSTEHTSRFLTALPTDGAFSRYAAAALASSKGRPAASNSRATCTADHLPPTDIKANAG
jgi:hypothetical protein